MPAALNTSVGPVMHSNLKIILPQCRTPCYNKLRGVTKMPNYIKVIETKFYLQRLSKIINKGQNKDELRNNIKNFISEAPWKNTHYTYSPFMPKVKLKI